MSARREGAGAGRDGQNFALYDLPQTQDLPLVNGRSWRMATGRCTLQGAVQMLVLSALERAATDPLQPIAQSNQTHANKRHLSQMKEEQPNKEALHYAVQDGNLEKVRELIETGSDPNQFDRSLSWTPLHYAAKGEHLDIAKLLLAHGADVNARDED